MSGGEVGIGVLASGAGTNLQALLDRVHGRKGLRVVGVGSDRPGATALDRARAAGVATATFPRDGYADRAARDGAMAEWLLAQGARLVVLAGYMQLVTPGFLAAFADRVINVHPALLPAFPGLRAIEQALAYGVTVAGVTVHFVDEGVDSGAIILQRAIDVPPGATPGELHDLLRPHEHELLCRAVELVAAGAVSFDSANPRRTVIAADGAVPTSLEHVHVTAPPGSATAARSFYGEVLGLAEIPPAPEFAGGRTIWFACGAQQIHVGIHETGHAPARKGHPALRLADAAALAAVARRIAAAGGELSERDTSEPPVRRLYTTDPFGNRVELNAPLLEATGVAA